VLDGTSTEARVRLEQLGDTLFDIPITMTLSYADGSSEDVVVVLTDKVTERSLPLKRALRSIDVNRDGGALAEIER